MYWAFLNDIPTDFKSLIFKSITSELVRLDILFLNLSLIFMAALKLTCCSIIRYDSALA